MDLLDLFQSQAEELLKLKKLLLTVGNVESGNEAQNGLTSGAPETSPPNFISNNISTAYSFTTNSSIMSNGSFGGEKCVLDSDRFANGNSSTNRNRSVDTRIGWKSSTTLSEKEKVGSRVCACTILKCFCTSLHWFLHVTKRNQWDIPFLDCIATFSG